MLYRIRRALDVGLDHLLVPRCWLCDGDAGDGRDLCRACFHDLPWQGPDVCPVCATCVPSPGICGACLRTPGPIALTHAALRYENEARELVHAFKFDHDLVAGCVLAQALLANVSTHCQDTMLVPVPSTNQRLRQRGFDPALEVARHLCRALPDVFVLQALVRRDRHAPQSTLRSRRGRQANVRGVFHVKQPEKIRPVSTITLVDDVLTTGATANAAARALRRCGVRQVNLWVCARTP